MITNSGLAQYAEQAFTVPEGYVACDSNHTGPDACYVTIPEYEPGFSYREIVDKANASRLDDPFATSPRPFRWGIAYDRKLLDTYTQEEVEATIIEQSKNRMLRAFDNSAIEHYGIDLFLYPWDFPAYSSIFDIMNMIDIKDDGKLDDMVKMFLDSLDVEYIQAVTLESATGKGVNSQMNSELFDHNRNTGVVNYREFILGSVTSCHECGHGFGCGHYSTNGVDSYSRPYVNVDDYNVYIHTFMKYGNILLAEADAFSGPNSYDANYLGDTIYLYDTVNQNTNNAAMVEMALEAYRLQNEVTQVRILGGECGNDVLIVETNNADSFLWEVVRGDIELSSTTDQEIEYIAHSNSTLRLIAGNSDKKYSDTAYVELPAMIVMNLGTVDICHDDIYILENGDTAVVGLNIYYEIDDSCLIYSLNVLNHDDTYITIDTTMIIGDILPDGQIITSSGSYSVIIHGEGEWCDLVITYNIDAIVNTEEHQTDLKVILAPNPTNGNINIFGLKVKDIRDINLYNMTGKLVNKYSPNNYFDITDINNGMYIWKILTKEHIITGKLNKN